MKQEKIDTVAVIDVQDVEFSREKGLQFNVLVDIAPEFKLPKYKKIGLKREKAEVADADVEKTLSEILERFSRYEDVTDQAATVPQSSPAKTKRSVRNS